MNVSELRIGNIVQNGDGDVITVNGALIDNNEGIDNEYTGITLTEEWLLIFGFNQTIDNVFRLFNFALRWGPNGWEFMDGFAGSFHKIRHVHQLQNVYFALTGKDLTTQKGTPEPK